MSLTLPQPTNFRGQLGGGTVMVESDVFNICERIKEIDPRLYLYEYKEPVPFNGRVYRFVVCEHCADGVERFVKRFELLDARVIEELQYMLHVPFEERVAAAERLEEKWAAEHKEEELENLYETMGGPMWSQFEHDGFMQRNRSYAKRGVRAA